MWRRKLSFEQKRLTLWQTREQTAWRQKKRKEKLFFSIVDQRYGKKKLFQRGKNYQKQDSSSQKVFSASDVMSSLRPMQRIKVSGQLPLFFSGDLESSD